jgi:hypothetical protein
MYYWHHMQRLLKDLPGKIEERLVLIAGHLAVRKAIQGR